jgi:hypothetical protein
MVQFKRFFILLYIHLTLSVVLTYLSTMVVFQTQNFSEDWLNTLVGLGLISAIYGVIGLLWGLLSIQKKKLLLPLILYVLILCGLFAAGVYDPKFRILFINGNIPFMYFVRNVATRSVLTEVIFGLSCVVPSWALFTSFNMAFAFVHRNDPKVIQV